MNVRWLSPMAKLSALSGLAWALIACFIGYRAFGARMIGGIIVAPLIGIFIGHLSSPLQNKPRRVQIAGSLFSLYVAAACFAIGMALCSPVFGPRTVSVPAALMEHVVAVLWGLTFGGYALVLWPLSFFNQRVVWQADAGQIPPSPQVRTTTPAIRTLAVGMMVLSVIGYAAWALVQGGIATVGSSASTMPWWVVTGLMAWSRWFVLGIFVWLFAPVLAFGAALTTGSEERPTATYRELMGVVGFAVFVFPILSFAATLAVTAIKIAIVHSWATEGTVFWAPIYYRTVFRMYLPWFLVGAGMIVVRRLTDGRGSIGL